jgi:hypothetical protein
MRWILLGLLLCAGSIAAADEEPDAYAIVIGSNTGGTGQTPLRFAEDDARRVADVLGDLANVPSSHVSLLLHPTPDQVLAAVDRVAHALEPSRKNLVFFYYSGHARATALELGGELPLTTLRERLGQLPATLTVVVLDACQSGAFSRIKGAEPAADFSFNSRSRLDSAGIAVMASSTASELSQESDTIGGSYFTNYFVAGLRGAGDRNGDGRVSLDESYQYAYHQTLLATAVTAVGSQHVTLEVDLKGQGEVPLTYPERARARLELPERIVGEVYVERLPAQAVLAELSKARGAPVTVALPPGEYRVLVHHDHVIDRCAAHVAANAIALPESCDTIPEVTVATKGASAGGLPLWQIGVSFAIGKEVDDAYTQRLSDFGYAQNFDPHTKLSAFVLRRLAPYLAVGGERDETFAPTWKRSTEAMPLTYSYGVTSASAVVRAAFTPGRWTLFAQGALGVAWGHDTLTDANGVGSSSNTVGFTMGLTGGVTFWALRHVGFSTTFGYEHTPAVSDQIGDTHDAGGLYLGFGLEVK